MASAYPEMLRPTQAPSTEESKAMLALLFPTRCHHLALLAGLLGVFLTTPGAMAAAPLKDANEISDLQFALLRYAGGNWNPRPHGLPRLAWEIRKRTSIAMGLEVAAVDPASEALFNYPLVVWQGDAGFPALSESAVGNLRQHINRGGTLLVDVSDGIDRGPFESAARRELTRVFPDQPMQRVANEHVLYKSFYLLDRHGGRVPTRPYLDGIVVENRLAVILSANDLAGAMARNEFGEWDYDVGSGGPASREMTFRLGINWVMYALCLDYKEDQVHIPFILQRRR